MRPAAHRRCVGPGGGRADLRAHVIERSVCRKSHYRRVFLTSVTKHASHIKAFRLKNIELFLV